MSYRDTGKEHGHYYVVLFLGIHKDYMSYNPSKTLAVMGFTTSADAHTRLEGQLLLNWNLGSSGDCRKAFCALSETLIMGLCSVN